MDTYIEATSKAALEAFCAGKVSSPIKSGKAAASASTDEYGNERPATPAYGDTAKFYACVRTDEKLTLPDGLSAFDTETGVKIVGVIL